MRLLQLLLILLLLGTVFGSMIVDSDLSFEKGENINVSWTVDLNSLTYDISTPRDPYILVMGLFEGNLDVSIPNSEQISLVTYSDIIDFNYEYELTNIKDVIGEDDLYSGSYTLKVNLMYNNPDYIFTEIPEKNPISDSWVEMLIETEEYLENYEVPEFEDEFITLFSDDVLIKKIGIRKYDFNVFLSNSSGCVEEKTLFKLKDEIYICTDSDKSFLLKVRGFDNQEILRKNFSKVYKLNIENEGIYFAELTIFSSEYETSPIRLGFEVDNKKNVFKINSVVKIGNNTFLIIIIVSGILLILFIILLILYISIKSRRDKNA